MLEMILVGGAIVVCAVLITLTYWAVVTKEYSNPLDEIQHLSDTAAELVDTAQVYKDHGMDQEALECMEEAERLNKKVWEVINGVQS